MPSPFALPDQGLFFTEQVLARCKGLIEVGIWAGLTTVQIDAWMSNFETPEERYFGACVLDALIFRSEDQTVAIMRHQFNCCLPNLNLGSSESPGFTERLSRLTVQDDPLIRVVPVLSGEDSPTKSGPMLARLYRRALGFNSDWIIWPAQMESAVVAGVDTFIFIDDFLGTGHQFDEFATEFDLCGAFPTATKVYAPLVAHEAGIQYLSSIYRDLRICSAEGLTSADDLFHVNAPWFKDGVNSAESAKDFYFEMLRRRSLPLRGPERVGYGTNLLLRHVNSLECSPSRSNSGADWGFLREPRLSSCRWRGF